MSAGIVYVLTNDAFNGYVKIGRTKNLTQRLQTLDNTSVPLPFRCVYAVSVPDMKLIEDLAHDAFAHHRVRKNREFFEVDAARVIAALKMTGGEEVTPKDDIAADEEGIEALKKVRKIEPLTLFDIGLNVGDIISFSKDETQTAAVCSARRVMFREQEMSLSASALILIREQGYTWQQVNGWAFWMYDDMTLSAHAERYRQEQANDEDSIG